MVKKNEKANDEIDREPYWDQFLKKLLQKSGKFDPKRAAIKIAGIYMLLGALWILLSDKILGLLVSDRQTLIMISLAKGWICIAVTGLVVFSLINSALKKIKASNEEIMASREEMRRQLDRLKESREQLAQSEERLHHMACYDVLTGLPGRMALYENLSGISEGSADRRGALFFIDLDDFKFINDSKGHSFGDRLIKRSGERLVRTLENTGAVYRLGGDEFVIVAGNVEKKEEAETLASKILSAFKRPFRIGESTLHINISIGVSLYPEHGRDIDELLRCADIAMYRAKKEGRNRYVVYSQPMNDVVAERVLIEKHMHTALENGEFELHYQPQLDINENRVTGLEALLRWHSRELGSVSPLKFIRIAEQTQLIMPLGNWVLRKACSFIKNLYSQGHTNITLSVNISVLQLLQNNFENEVLEVLESYELEPECLELEITESVLIESYEAIEGKLRFLHGKGVRIALDDFGKGYSSLSYLKQLPISTLKIDKSFIDGISSGSGDEPLTGHIVTMGRSMGLNVIAEGVETPEQVDYLLKHKCDKIQGFLFSRPLPEREAEILVLNGSGLEKRKQQV